MPRGARPAAERVRQAIMSSLGPRIAGARVLDLYCGSGAYALEALSRGADEAVLVDQDADAVRTARENSRAAGSAEWTKVRRVPVERYLARDAADDGPFDLVFADPPYVHGEPSGAVLEKLASVIAPDARVVWEAGRARSAFEPPLGWVVEDDRRYGDTRVLILSHGRQP